MWKHLPYFDDNCIFKLFSFYIATVIAMYYFSVPQSVNLQCYLVWKLNLKVCIERLQYALPYVAENTHKSVSLFKKLIIS